MTFWGNCIGLTATMLMFAGAGIIAIGSISLAAEVHWLFAFALLLVPVWMAGMYEVMEWATDL